MVWPIGVSMTRGVRRDLAIVGLLLGLALLFFWRIAFAGKLLVGADIIGSPRPWNPLWGDNILQFYPWAVLAADSWKEGVPPLWNPYVFSGTPFAAKGQAAVFYPFNLILWRILSPARAFGYSAILHLFLAGLFMYAFSRAIKISRFGSFVGALTFMFNGYFVTLLWAPSIVYTMTWLPAVLYLVERSLQETSLAYALFAGLALGMQFLAGYPAVSSYLLVAFGLYVLYRLVVIFTESKNLRAIAPALCLAGISVVIGFSLGAVQLLPFFELGPLSERVGWRPASLELNIGTIVGELVHYATVALVPEFYGNHIDWNRQFPPGTQFLHWHTIYVGIFPLILTGVALLLRRDKWTRFFALWAALALLTLSGFLYSRR